jgi:predicted nucleic acid-binding protein
MKTLLVDTDILVDYLRGVPKAVRFVRDHAESIVLSVISVAELHTGVRDDEEERALAGFLELFPLLPVTPEVAVRGGRYCREFAKSHQLGLADALIAATAVEFNAELRTLNTKHFPMLKGLRLPYKKS